MVAAMTIRKNGWLASLLLLACPAWAGSYAVIGDAGLWNAKTRGVRDSIHRADIHDLVMPGDNLYRGRSYDTHWAPWREKGFTFPVVAIGNHNGGYAEEIEYFGMPGEFYSVHPEPGVLFIVLNSDNTRSIRRQTEFLRKELTQAREKLIFVVFHHPFATISPRHEWEEKEDFHLSTTPLLLAWRNKITAVLLGHDHLATWFEMDGLQAFVSGAAHEVLATQPVTGRQRGLRIKTQCLLGSQPSWLRLETDPKNGIAHFDFIRAQDDTIQCSASLPLRSH